MNNTSTSPLPIPAVTNNTIDWSKVGTPVPDPTIGNALKELGGNLDQLREALNTLDTRSATLRSVGLQRTGTAELDEADTNHVYSRVQQHNRTLVALISRLDTITQELDV